MEDFSGPVSTTLDPGAGIATTTGGGAPPPEPVSVRDSVAAAVKEAALPEEKPATEEPVKGDPAPKDPKTEDKGAEKPEKVEKPAEEKKTPDRGDNGKFVAKAADEGDTKPDADAIPEDGKELNTQAKQGFSQAPKNFLPDAKEKWANTPRSVQRDVENMIRETETRETQHRETVERYERIRPYDELAKSNGRDLTESLQRVHQIENLMAKNPLAGLNAILMEAGPRKADGQPFSLFEVAEHIVQSGRDGYQRMVQVQPEARQHTYGAQPNPELEQVKQQLADMRQQQVAATIIEPFKATHPRYEELRDDIAFFLSSGKIPQSLSQTERLAAAYDMAERINPSSTVPQARQSGPGDDETSRADNDSSGLKSIRSAPGSVTPDEEPERGGSIREELMRAVQRQRRA